MSSGLSVVTKRRFLSVAVRRTFVASASMRSTNSPSAVVAVGVGLGVWLGCCAVCDGATVKAKGKRQAADAEGKRQKAKGKNRRALRTLNVSALLPFAFCLLPFALKDIS